MDGKRWAKVSKRGITNRKMAKTESPYLHAHLHINMNSLRKSFKRPWRSSDYEHFLMRTSKECNPEIRGQVKKR